MLKFIFVAFLFLGLIVQGQFDQENTEVAKDAVEFNEKTAKEDVVQESEENEESSEQEEESEEEEQSDYAGAVDKVTTNMEDFDQEDDMGSKVMKDDNDEEEQDDESGGRCYKPRCGYFLAARRAFYHWRNRCIRCLRGRIHYCRRMCHYYHLHRRNNYLRCRRWVMHRIRGWTHALRVNWHRIAHANNMMRRYAYAIRVHHARVKRMSWRTVVHRRNHFYRHFIANRNAMVAWHRRRMWFYHRIRWAYHHRNIWLRRRNWHQVRRWNRYIHHLRRHYVHALRVEAHFRRRMRHFLHWFHVYNRYYHIWRYIHRLIHAYRVWRNRRNHYLRRRHYLIRRRNAYYHHFKRICFRHVRALYWRCVLCKGACGGNCWHMHRFYALAIFRAHMCKLQHVLCRRKVYYLRRFHAWNRACHYCWRRTHPHMRLLVCGHRCWTRIKYLWLYRYYHRKCHR